MERISKLMVETDLKLSICSRRSFEIISQYYAIHNEKSQYTVYRFDQKVFILSPLDHIILRTKLIELQLLISTSISSLSVPPFHNWCSRGPRSLE